MNTKIKGDQAPLLVIEGNMGAGKSTFLKIIEKHLDIDAIFEPATKWQAENDQENLLHLFYKDISRWAYTFQSYAFISRVNALLKNHDNLHAESKDSRIKILERSVYCDRYCFAKNCFESGFMTKMEWNIYKEWFSWLADRYTPRPRGFIYMQTTPQTCYNRMKKRSRSEEIGVSLSYLTALHKRHEDWLVHKRGISEYLVRIPVLILDCNEEFETNTNIQKKHINAIQKFIDIFTIAHVHKGSLNKTLVSN
jgi:deoxyadenosine/deoxycytidine kinase